MAKPKRNDTDFVKVLAELNKDFVERLDQQATSLGLARKQLIALIINDFVHNPRNIQICFTPQNKEEQNKEDDK